jgi:hypothetical protein
MLAKFIKFKGTLHKVRNVVRNVVKKRFFFPGVIERNLRPTTRDRNIDEARDNAASAETRI